VALDMNTIEKMLAPDFLLPNSRPKTNTAGVYRSHAFPQITRFDASVLTVEPRGNDWSVFVFVKGEVETKDNRGKTSKGYIVLVARGGWRKLNDNQWTLLWSEQLGQQLWEEQIPPIANW
jgi:hypothetical protein